MRENLIQPLRSVIGKPYRWGGQSPDVGLDCSGLCVWWLGQCGIPGFPKHDFTAQGLYEWFHPNKIMQDAAPVGSLYFYWNEKKNSIGHVMIVLDIWPDGRRILVGARGGDATTTSYKRAAEQKAFVDIVMGDYWQKNFALAVDPLRGVA